MNWVIPLAGQNTPVGRAQIQYTGDLYYVTVVRRRIALALQKNQASQWIDRYHLAVILA